MAKSATVEVTDNDGYIVRTHGEWDDKGNQTEEPKLEVATSLKDVGKFLEKNLGKGKGEKSASVVTK